MEEQDERRNVDNGSERQKQVKEETLLKFLDSMDGYLSLLDSLSSALRQVTKGKSRPFDLQN